jgi:predicted nucleotidyltransferase
MTFDPILREIRTRLDGEFGARLRDVVLYGSVARGDATRESDLDLIVVLRGPIQLGHDLDRIVTVLYPVQLELDRAIHALPVSEEAFTAAQYGLYRNAKREGLRL